MENLGNRYARAARPIKLAAIVEAVTADLGHGRGAIPALQHRVPHQPPIPLARQGKRYKGGKWAARGVVVGVARGLGYTGVTLKPGWTMSEQPKDAQEEKNLSANDIRAPWQRPEWRKLGTEEAESGAFINFDGNSFS